MCNVRTHVAYENMMSRFRTYRFRTMLHPKCVMSKHTNMILLSVRTYGSTLGVGHEVND